MTTMPTGAPDETEVTAYLVSAGLNPDKIGTDAIRQAIAAETEDQARRLRFPVSAGVPSYTLALAEALCRRVARNLAVRPLPLGVQPTVTDAGPGTAYIGSSDPEVRRLEAPYRRRPLG
jgi:alkanesulfonate monooxygenase SsuD/methylene tetrahydromethanopterin reductase-like flavin-dependent oxidoreductase (luciferase family)